MVFNKLVLAPCNQRVVTGILFSWIPFPSIFPGKIAFIFKRLGFILSIRMVLEKEVPPILTIVRQYPVTALSSVLKVKQYMPLSFRPSFRVCTTCPLGSYNSAMMGWPAGITFSLSSRIKDKWISLPGRHTPLSPYKNPLSPF